MSQIFRGLAEPEHPHDWGQRGVHFFFSLLIILIINSFSLLQNYFPIYLVCEES